MELCHDVWSMTHGKKIAEGALITTLRWLNEVHPGLQLQERQGSQQPQIKVSVDLKALLDTATDFLCFVTEFFEVISESAPHIYHSALPLAPTSSIIQELYRQQIFSVGKVVTGIPTSWDSCMAISAATFRLHDAIWSPCGQWIAAGLGSVIEVWDSTTLKISYILKPPGLEDHYPDHLAFSPDGHLLICAYRLVFDSFPCP